MNHLPNILIVDDNTENLKYLEIVLNKLKVNMIQALSGQEALEKTRGIDLALAIIDVRMPGMNGYELALKMNEERSHDKVSIIFVTASQFNESDTFKGYESGAVDYIYKPINIYNLVCKINIFLNLFDQKQKIVRDIVLLEKSTDELSKVNAALHKREEELKSSLEQLRHLTQYIEKIREDERVAISRELHDDLGQSLTAVKIDLGIIRQNVSDPETVLKIKKVSALVSETIKTVQRLTSQLRPPILDDLGLKAAIEWYTKEFAQRKRVEVFLDIDSGVTLSPEICLILFRIMQEALTNIARHSKATRIHIGLTKTIDYINFMIFDNGIGITQKQIKAKNAFGIISMKERAASIGGTLDISNENDRGTKINLILPLKNIGTHENSDL